MNGVIHYQAFDSGMPIYGICIPGPILIVGIMG
jgi:hypothetical protein